MNSQAAEEIAFHLEQEIAANISRGMSPAEARRTALRDLGGATQTIEAVRDVRTMRLDAWARDVRYAVRSLWAAPGFTAVALAVLALSIGASTAIFSVVDHVVLRRLPFPDDDRLVAVGERHLTNYTVASGNLVAPQNYLDWRDQQTVFTGLAAIGYASISLRAEGGEPETLETQAVTADFFSILGVPPMLGRSFTADNEVSGRALVAVISYRLWQRRFNGSPDVIGQFLPGQRANFEIVGVMPPSFAFPVGAVRPTDVWIPNVFGPDDRVRADSFAYRLQVIGRLRPEVSLTQAQAAMDQIAARLKAETPRWFEDRVALVEPLQTYLTRGVRTWMLMLLGTVSFVLLIACVNLTNLMLVRLSARHRDLVVRSALGASRWDLARGLLVESVLLSLTGGALGVLVASLGLEVLRSAIPAEVPRAASIGIDLPVLLTMLAVATAVGVVLSAAPFIQFSRRFGSATVAHVMRVTTGTTAQQRLRGALVTFEVALAVILLVGAGLFLASFARVASVPLGIDARDVLAIRIRPLVEADQWALAQQRNRGLLRVVLDEVRAIRGVADDAFVGSGVPLRGDLRTIRFQIPGRPLPRNEDLDFNEISPDYFRVMKVPLIQGRFFSEADREGSEPVAIINQAAAEKHFRGEDAVGQTVEFLGRRRVVGVVGNIRHEGPETDWRTQGFVPLEQTKAVGATLMVRLSREPGDVLPAIKAAIWRQFPGLALPDVQTLEQYLGTLTAQRRFNMLLLSLFGILGIAIAAIGIYGVMAYTVAQRTQEIGVRLALGAMPAAIQRSVLGRAARYLGGGLVIGLVGAWLLSALVSGFLFQIEPHDPWVYTVVGIVLSITAMTAAFLPARRAARVDPLVALRLE
jgi:putative ABC transport system permease protein